MARRTKRQLELAEKRCKQRGGKWNPKTNDCRMPIPGRKLTVHRDPHRRKSYVKDVIPGPGVKRKRIPATKVKGARFPIKDVGAPGRGKVKIPITQRGALTKHGWDMSKGARARHVALDKAVHAMSGKRVYHRLLALRNVREDPAGEPGPSPPRANTTKGKQWRLVDADMNYVKKKHNPRLTPTKAIKKWKSMSKKERARRMPGGGKKRKSKRRSGGR